MVCSKTPKDEDDDYWQTEEEEDVAQGKDE